ncbi:MAG TPA: hypothetical protein VKH43_06645 [Thermoanaerobaculia bacterium]|nr:hypothetical protein [Thermoanaerobaculia bacterium]
MKTVVGIFGSESAAETAAASLVTAGVSPARIRRLTPESSENEIHAAIPTTETEQPGMGRAVGGLVGGVVGAMIVLTFVALAGKGVGALSGASYLLTAVGAGLFAVAGAFAGGALEDRLFRGLPKDEIYFYEEALRRGRSVVFVFASNRQERMVRETLGRAGAASLDAGDESWKVGIKTPQNVHGRTGRQAS